MDKIQLSDVLMEKTGEMDFRLTNDYLFRIIFQENEEALKGLLAAILHLKSEDIRSTVIENPIQPGASLSEKEYRMDILLTLNNNQRIDLEMQVKNEGDWRNRSLMYMSREYGRSLKRGEVYKDAVSMHQIGILSFDLFEDHPEFCGTYMMKNVEDGYTYNSNFKLTVVQLGQINRATKEDEESGLVKWAKLFLASTWEDLRMIAKENESMTVAANATAYYESDYAVRKRMEDREDFLAWKANMEEYKRMHEADQRQHELDQRQIKEMAARIKELEEKLNGAE